MHCWARRCSAPNGSEKTRWRRSARLSALPCARCCASLGEGRGSMKPDIRKLVVTVEETHREAGRGASPATRKAAAVAVIANPFAGKYVEDLTPLIDIGEEL